MKKSKGNFKKGIFYAVLIFIIVTIIQNRSIVLTEYEVSSDKLAAGEEFTIVQLSDIHFINDKKQAERLLQLTQESAPDLIAITGDLIDTPKYTEQKAENEANGTDFPIGQETIDFCKELVEIAPCYFIYGNHEMSLLDDPERNEFMLALLEAGVHIINNQTTQVEVEVNRSNRAAQKGLVDGNSQTAPETTVIANHQNMQEEPVRITLNLLGVQDPSTLYKDAVYAHSELSHKEKVEVILDDLYEGLETSKFTLVLSHRPEYFDLYTGYDMDLLLAGHAHGGQFRLPFVREGLVAPGQGFFPSYTSGEYIQDDFTMIVSRGIGNSIIPVRIFNTPEVVAIRVIGTK